MATLESGVQRADPLLLPVYRHELRVLNCNPHHKTSFSFHHTLQKKRPPIEGRQLSCNPEFWLKPV